MNQPASLMQRASPEEQQASPQVRKPPDEDFFTRTILTGARKAYYDEKQQPQVLKMIESGASPGAGVAMAAMTILQTVGETLNEQGKPCPPELLFNPDGPIDFIVEDLSELVSAQYDIPVEEIQTEADAVIDQQLARGAPSPQADPQTPPQQPAPAQTQPQGLIGMAQGIA